MVRGVGWIKEEGVRLAVAHFPEDEPNALLGLTGLPFLFALLAFESLQRYQKPRCLWLAINHGGHSFQIAARTSQGCSGWMGPPAPVFGFAVTIGSSPAFAPVMPEQLDRFSSSIHLMRSLQPAVNSFVGGFWRAFSRVSAPSAMNTRGANARESSPGNINCIPKSHRRYHTWHKRRCAPTSAGRTRCTDRPHIPSDAPGESFVPWAARATRWPRRRSSVRCRWLRCDRFPVVASGVRCAAWRTPWTTAAIR